METIAEIAVILVAAWPLARLCLTPPFLRKLRSFPALAATLAVGLTAGAVVLGAALAFAPALLRALTLVAGLGLLWAAWRARPAYGRSRGLPPGSLGVLPVGPLVDDRFFLRQAQRHGPVFKTSQYLRPMVCVVGLARGHELLRRYDDQLTPPALPFDRFIPGGFLRSMPAALHDRYAPLVRAALRGDTARDVTVTIAARARRALDDMARDSAAPGAGVAPRPYLSAMMSALLVELFFGIAPGSPAAERLRALYRVIDVRNPSGALRRRAGPALEEIARIVRAEGTGPGQLVEIAQPARSGDPEDVVLFNVIYILQNARDDVAGLLLWSLKMLGDSPGWAQRLRESAAGASLGAAQADDLARRIVMETLRLEQSEFLFRATGSDLVCDGFVIPRGWLVRLCVRESHRAPEIFAQPEVFDPDRFLGRSPAREEYSPFGAPTSRHACVGEPLARRVGGVFLAELAGGYDWRVVSDGPREFDGWHWTPSARFRIHVARRPARASSS